MNEPTEREEAQTGSGSRHDRVVNKHFCAECGAEKEYVDCWNCGGEGLTDHDCGEDTCCCLHPRDNVSCDICDGEGIYLVCPICHPGAFDDYAC